MRTGRPTKYRKDFPERAAKLWAKGHTDEEVCKKLKISHESLAQYQRLYPEFLAAKKEAKAIADQCVERALFQRATGVVLPDCHVSQFEGRVIVTPLKKHYPPDPVSMIFWLKNRKPKEWRDRTEVTGADGTALIPQEAIAFGQALLRASLNGSENNGVGSASR